MKGESEWIRVFIVDDVVLIRNNTETEVIQISIRVTFSILISTIILIDAHRAFLLVSTRGGALLLCALGTTQSLSLDLKLLL